MEPIRTPENTTKTPGLLVALLPDGIKQQERQGQQQLLASTVLPTNTGGTDTEFEALGFTFGDVVRGDDIFRQATLPAGWAREGSDHAMWSYIVDTRGIRRVAIFYKAAFYDRSASMQLVNVGDDLATHFIHGDAPTPTIHPELTSEERADALASVDVFFKQAEQYPYSYSDRLPRALALRNALTGEGSAN